MLDMEASLEETIRNSEDPLETALLYARIGNYIDFAALSNVNSDTVLSLLKEDNKEPLNAQEYLHFRKDLSAASRLVYLTDNCGEIVLDKLVIILLKELCPELDITVIVRGFPVINDATMEDAQDIGLTELTTVIGNGNEVGGTWLPHISSEARAGSRLRCQNYPYRPRQIPSPGRPPHRPEASCPKAGSFRFP